MSSEEDDGKQTGDKNKKRGRKRERPEQGNCEITSIYQFFTIARDLAHGYDYRCVLCANRGGPVGEALITNCVGPTNLFDHFRRVHHFLPATSQTTAEQKRAFFGTAGIPKDKVLIARDLLGVTHKFFLRCLRLFCE